MTDFNLWTALGGQWRIERRRQPDRFPDLSCDPFHDFDMLLRFLRRYSVPFFIEWQATEPE